MLLDNSGVWGAGGGGGGLEQPSDGKADKGRTAEIRTQQNEDERASTCRQNALCTQNKVTSEQQPFQKVTQVRNKRKSQARTKKVTSE